MNMCNITALFMPARMHDGHATMQAFLCAGQVIHGYRVGRRLTQQTEQSFSRSSLTAQHRHLRYRQLKHRQVRCREGARCGLPQRRSAAPDGADVARVGVGCGGIALGGAGAVLIEDPTVDSILQVALVAVLQHKPGLRELPPPARVLIHAVPPFLPALSSHAPDCPSENRHG